MNKLHINLYDASLLPARLKLDFNRLILACVAVLLLLGGAFAVLSFKLKDLESSIASVKQQTLALDAERQHLEAQLKAHQPDSALINEVSELDTALDIKRLLLSEIGKQQGFVSQGYGALLTDLASVADGNVWLDKIVVAKGELRFEGQARDPKSVPLWIERLKETRTLQGKQFAAMTMARDEDKPLGFVLTSSGLAGGKP